MQYITKNDMELLLRSQNREGSMVGSSGSMQLASYQINKQVQTNNIKKYRKLLNSLHLSN